MVLKKYASLQVLSLLLQSTSCCLKEDPLSQHKRQVDNEVFTLQVETPVSHGSIRGLRPGPCFLPTTTLMAAVMFHVDGSLQAMWEMWVEFLVGATKHPLATAAILGSEPEYGSSLFFVSLYKQINNFKEKSNVQISTKIRKYEHV